VALTERAKSDFIQGLNAELPSTEQALTNKVLEVLSAEMPRLERELTANIRAEIGKLVESVRLVFSAT